MKLYYDPVSTTSRPVMLLIEQARLPIEREIASILTGDTRTDAFRAINPAGQVPVLVDGEFVLTECAAILKYLAETHAPRFYASDPRERARIDEMISFVSTDLHLWLDVFTVYPASLLAETLSGSAAAELAAVAAPRVSSTLSVLDVRLRKQAFLAGDRLSIADFLGSSYLTLAELIAFDFQPWPALAHWIDRMKSLDGWGECFAGFEGLKSALSARKQLAA